jgi:hypothetical protein
MRVATVYVRFYRAFNFDYLRKHHPGAQPDPWDIYEGLFYPYVKVDLDAQVTCIVGANESGKSQLLDAVEHGLGTRSPDAADFCRYSRFFTVDATLRVPHFGLRLVALSDDERTAFAKWSGAEAGPNDQIRVFRESSTGVKVFIGDAAEPIEAKFGKAPASWMPRSFRIDPGRPIPDSAPIEYLARGGHSDKVLSRRERWALVDPLVKGFSAIRAALSTNPVNSASLANLLPGELDLRDDDDDRTAISRRQQFELAYKLLVTVGGVHPSTFSKL